MESRRSVEKMEIDRFVLFENSSELMSDSCNKPAMPSYVSRRSGEIQKRRTLEFRWKLLSCFGKSATAFKMSRRIGVYQYPLIGNGNKRHGITVCFEEST